MPYAYGFCPNCGVKYNVAATSIGTVRPVGARVSRVRFLPQLPLGQQRAAQPRGFPSGRAAGDPKLMTLRLGK